ncbi:cytochrome P450 [Streptomyces griseoviridis]|uniref:cytochrome P450 n=1 Tax=Streptomyces griseoviridis TaxID=45398 RepID=UPI0033FF8B8F
MTTTIPDELTWPDSFPTRGHGLPPEMFDILRREQPVAPVTFPSGHRAWLVTRRADITAIGSSRDFSRDLTCPGGQRIAGDDFNSVPGGIFNLDPPEHTTVRRVVQPFFNPAAATALRPAIALAASDLATALREGPNPADLHRAYAHPLAATLACDLMRVAPRQRRKIVPRLRSQVDYTTPAAKIDTSTRWMLDFAAEVIEAKRADYDDGSEPRDPVEALIRAHHHGTITAEQLHATVMYLFVTSAEPVTGPVTTGVYTLLRHGDQLARILRDPGLWPTAVAELLRLHHNGMTSMPRLALADTELHGVRIRAGDAVVTPWVAATWDPEHYRQPERFRLDRGTREDPAITFGTGPHFCLGVNIARLYLQTALSTLFTQLPDLALAAKHEDIAWEPDTYLFTRPTELPVTWS